MAESSVEKLPALDSSLTRSGFSWTDPASAEAPSLIEVSS